MSSSQRLAVLIAIALSGAPAAPPAQEATEAPRAVPRRPEGLAPWALEERPAPRQSTTIVVPEGELPSYDTLRLRTGLESSLGNRFLETLPVLRGELFTTGTIFTDVPEGSPYKNMTLRDLVELTLRENLDLANQRRSEAINASATRSAEAFFTPFVDLVGDASIRQRRERVTRTLPPENPLDPTAGPRTVSEFETNETTRTSGGVEVIQNLPTGGRITASARSERVATDLNTAEADRDTSSRTYSSVASVRLDQPLLRGAGHDVATADLRRARLREAQGRIARSVAERDAALQVIRSYFRILALKQQLEVSADAIVERKRFLDETVKKYELGRVAEGEILNAEIQYLQELEGAVSRRQALEDERVNLVLLLGLPLETPISVVDITPELRERGRVEVPDPRDAVAEALSTRPELVREEIGVVLAEIDSRVARNNRLPNLDLTAGYQRDERDDTFDSANGLENDEWDVGASLRVPLINIQRREEHRRSLLSLDQARTTKLQRERAVQREVLNAHRAVLATESNLSILQKTVEQARRNLELTKGQYEVGFSSVTEVRLAQDDLFRAESRYTQALVDYQTALAELYVSLGRPLF